jgi:TetR/AcrR family transcriptional repressor of nem operon
MRFEKGHKDATRRHILDIASRRFRRDGIAATGLAGIMSDAGLTNGAFYGHFDSKDHLVHDAILQALDDVMSSGAVKSVESEVCAYLSSQHRDNPDSGCPSATLLAEIGRLPESTRTAYSNKVAAWLDRFAKRLSGKETKESREMAIAIYALVVGTLQLSRAFTDRNLSEAILAAGVHGARVLCGSVDDHLQSPRARPRTATNQPSGLASSKKGR